jgi:hypothetical protein
VNSFCVICWSVFVLAASSRSSGIGRPHGGFSINPIFPERTSDVKRLFSTGGVYVSRVALAGAALVCSASAVMAEPADVGTIEVPVDLAGAMTAFLLVVGTAIAAILTYKLAIKALNMGYAFISGGKVKGG